MQILVIGGSDAGIAAALRARELNKKVRITVLLADDYPDFSICGLPHLIGGEVENWSKLAHRSNFPDIDVRRSHRAISIDPDAKVVHVEHAGNLIRFSYDKLIIATGARPVRPDIPGADLPGVFLLHTIDDGLAIIDRVEGDARSAVIVGAGYIGLEMAEALRRRGLEVTLLSRSPEVMPSVFSEIGAIVRRKLADEGVKVLTGIGVDRVEEGLTVAAGGVELERLCHLAST